MTHAGIYIRQTEIGPPLHDQRAECVLAIESRGWRQSAEFLDAESFTGKPGSGYQELIAALRTKRVEIVVAYSGERMFRGVAGMVKVLEAARVGGVNFFLCREGLTTDGVPGAYLVRAARLLSDIDTARRSEIGRLWTMRMKANGVHVGRPRSLRQEIEAAIEEKLENGIPIGAIARELHIDRGIVRVRARYRNLEVSE